MANSLNSAGNSYASSLIAQGKVNKTATWSMSAADENAILGDPPNWGQYGKWHLGKDDSADSETKAHWKYPFGKGGNVYRSAVIAIRQRASQQGDTGIFDAAGKLVEKIDGDKGKDSYRAKDYDLNTKVFDIKTTGNKSADIYLYDSIGEGFFGGIGADRFTKELKALGKVQDLNVYINSDGGDVFDGFTIYQNLVRHSATVHTHIDGLAASIASLVAMAGNDINISDVGMVMIHKPWGMAVGTATDMRKRADTLDQVDGSIVRVYANRANRSEEDIRAMMEAETWMTAVEALEAGLVTNIAKAELTAACASPCIYDLKKFKNAPSWYGRKQPVEQPRLMALKAKAGQLFVLS